MPPLIKIKLLINDTLETSGIYDSGSNVSLINSRLLALKKIHTHNKKAGLKTINGVKKSIGMVTLKLKIFEIEKQVDVFVIDEENFDYNFLVGLDCIQKFKLTQNDNLEIIQITRSNEKTDYIKNKEKQPMITKQIPGSSGSDIGINKNEKQDIIQEYEINFNENILVDDFDISVNHLDHKKRSDIDQLICKYNSIFAKDKYDIGTVKGYEAHIDLLIDKYCSKRPYRCSIEDMKEIEHQVSKLLENNLIEESYSPFAAPVTLAFKKEEGRRSRLCIDFRELNKIVVPQSQPFPLIEDLMVKTRKCKFFSTFDVNSAFWSIPVKIEDRPKTAFVTQNAHYQWTCLPFGLKTAPAIFQRILSTIIRKHKLSDFTVNYIDDILVFSETFEKHIEHLSLLLEAILKEGFKLKFTKCHFAQDSVKYLGHIIKNNTVTPLKDNLIAIKEFPIPKTQKNVRQFLGKINFYGKYVPNMSIILDPLHNLLRKGEKFVWSDKCQESFDTMKKLLCSKPILAIFDPDLPIHIYTDASIQGIAAILKQIQSNGDEKPCAYFSKKLNNSQKQKKAIYLECLAVKEAVKYWQHWLIGKTFTVFTDHKPLENMNIKARTDEELGDLTFYLSQFNFKITYSPGKYNVEADTLSRNPVLEPCENEESCLKVVNFVKMEDIQQDQNNNEDIKQNIKKLIFKNNIYYKKTRKHEKIILTEEFSKHIIKQVHHYYCHLGRQQVENKMKPFYQAKHLLDNIKKICENCDVCIKNKSRGAYKFGLMSHLGPATYPFEIVSIDTIGGFGGARSTKVYLHLLVDHFTRYAYILTSKTQNANDFIKLVQKVTQDYKIDLILSDQYPGINSKEFKYFLEKEGISIVFTAVNAPFSNGLNERLNQTLVNKIRCKINERKDKIAWTTIAHECTERYNETEHSITGFSPKYLLQGKNVDILPNELKQNEIQNHHLIRDRKIALENSIKSHEYNKQRFDKNRRYCELEVGDFVYVENGNRINRKKLDELKIGPYQIVEKISNSIYKVNTGHKKLQSNLFHITKLIPVIIDD